MKNITQILSDEHQIILKVIDAVNSECDELEKGKTLDISFFQKTINFIKNYADKFHHAKEEDILFKAMLENVEHLHCNPIPVMLHEHDEGRTFVYGMEQGVSENNTDKIIQNARGYGMLLRDHIYKEDNVLYPMAEEALSDEQKELVNKKYTEVELLLNKEMNVNELIFV
ncbi:hemerythrin domain-containing protein [Mangrovibacterium diazotrophicum]|uniref:Hemerythrin-like domain-containing protein n=1 Tax=Mangrovibacterium diazotrophicum TaxID=1261403 RepID=A0A419W2V8_9BACT|nr:hemerythrin domain-containing protein [Mangrovibacterium diazotrophicum]RKD89769.1 hemerythrin-like domain-containing protein [Mangrovibacterium diazotrophicum]